MRWLPKIYVCFWAVLLSPIGCSKNNIERNPYLPNVPFSYQLNLRLPSYNSLNFAGGGHFIKEIGLNGVLVFNLNGSSFLAWEATCPNHAIENCSTLSLKGVIAECGCEASQYSLATGQLLNPTETNTTPYSLLFYQVQKVGDALLISN